MPRNAENLLRRSEQLAGLAPSKPAADLALSGLAHDLNNVFQTLLEAADLLSGDPRWVDVSAAILRSIERGKDISASMQAANQPSAPLEGVLRNAADFVLDSIHLGHGPAVKFFYDLATRVELRRSYAWERVFINLFTNSVRAMPEGGTIAVSARLVDRWIEIRVADDGSGIPAGLLPRIFEPHVSERANGGLGLHIVKTIVSEHDGQVHAANREGRGAEFLITIPVETYFAHTARA